MTTAYSGDGITFPDASVQATAPKVGMVNRVINGGMVFDQRNGGAEVSPAPSGYGLDRWATYKGGAGTWKVQQSTDAPAGFAASALLTVTSASTPSGNDYYILMQPIEGNNTFDLAWGSASAQTVTLSFWVKSSLTGTFGGALRNAAENRTYPFTFAISSANTWEYKSVVVVGDTSGTWLTTNGRGITLTFSFGGSGTSLATAGAWSASGASGATGQTNIIATSGATWQITGVQLEKGSTATDFDYRPYGTELALCQRYYTKMTTGGGIYTGFSLGYQTTTTAAICTMKFPMTMRSAPTLNQSNCAINDTLAFTGAITSITGVFAGPDSARFSANFTPAGGAIYRPVDLIANANSAAFFEISAEL